MSASGKPNCSVVNCDEQQEWPDYVERLSYRKIAPDFRTFVHEGALPRSDVVLICLFPIGHRVFSTQSAGADFRRECMIAEPSPEERSLHTETRSRHCFRHPKEWCPKVVRALSLLLCDNHEAVVNGFMGPLRRNTRRLCSKLTRAFHLAADINVSRARQRNQT